MLPREIFQYNTGEQQIKDEAQVFYVIEKVSFDKGVQVWIKGAQYEQKGMAQPETLFAMNIAKRLLVKALSLGQNWLLAPSFALIGIIPYKRKLNALETIVVAYNDIAFKVTSPYLLKPEYMTDSARELGFVICSFLEEVGLKSSTALQFSKIVSHLIEYDNAYRFRMQDLFTATTSDLLLKSPIKELKRLARLSKERDSAGVSKKFQTIIFFTSLLLLHPRIRKAFKVSIKECDFSKLQFDKIDEYWVSMRTDYKYYGEDAEQRSLRNLGKSMPTPVPLEEYNKLKECQK